MSVLCPGCEESVTLMTRAQLDTWLRHRRCGGAPPGSRDRDGLSGVTIDSRKVTPGCVFVALPGDRTHGVRFAGRALEAGAAVALVPADVAGQLPDQVSPDQVVVVDDAVRALWDLARGYRATWTARVVGITGSSGKTTTKDMTAELLGRVYHVAKTAGNYNNHLGVPLTLLNAPITADVVVVEMGMSAPGEIGALAALAQPEIGVVTNVGVAHVGALGSRAAVMRAKLEIVPELRGQPTLVVGGDDARLVEAARRFSVRLVTTGRGTECELRATDESFAKAGAAFRAHGMGFEGEWVHVGLGAPVAVDNALLALATGRLLQLEPTVCATALAAFAGGGGRLHSRAVGQWRVIDDTYNANPESMRAALATLALAGSGRRLAVLGDMLELGAAGPAAHAALGGEAARVAERLYVVGEFAATVGRAAVAAGMQASAVYVARDKAQLTARLLGDLEHGDVILVKGSRGLGLETVVKALAEAAGGEVEA